MLAKWQSGNATKLLELASGEECGCYFPYHIFGNAKIIEHEKQNLSLGALRFISIEGCFHRELIRWKTEVSSIEEQRKTKRETQCIFKLFFVLFSTAKLSI